MARLAKPDITKIEDEIIDVLKEEQPIEMVSQDVPRETLEEQIDEVIEDFKQEEIILNELEQEEMQVSNNQLYKTMLDINETLIISKREELIVDNKIFRAIEKNISITEKVNDKYSKTTFAIMTTLFVLGLLIGMIDEKWLPYLGNILDFARTATNVVK